MTKKITKILLAGEGGQGIQALSKILSQALLHAGYEVSYIPQFGPEQRGTPSVAFIQFGKEKITYPKFSKADILVILRQRALKMVTPYLATETVVVFDSSTIPRNLISQNNSKVFGIPATKLAEENFSSKVLNIIVLGVLARKFFDLAKNNVWTEVEKQLSKKFAKSPDLRKLNKQALEAGYDFVLEQKKYSRPTYDTSDKIIISKEVRKTAILIPKLCKGCGICILKCPVAALKFGKTLGVYGTPTPEIDLKKCIVCGICSRFCPDCAIKVLKK